MAEKQDTTGSGSDDLAVLQRIFTSFPTSAPADQQTVWPARFITGASPGGGGGQTAGYTGSGLVNRRNVIEQEQYNITEGLVRDVYSSLQGDERQFTFDTLEAKGFYGDAGRSKDPKDDLTAIRQWLEESNLAGYTKERYIFELLKNPDRVRKTGGARRYQVSNPEDLKAVFKRVAQDTIGRAFTDQEAAQAVQSYQQQELAAQRAAYGGGTVTQVMGADVFAEQFAQQVAPTEANGYKFLGYMNKLFNAAGGR